MENKILFVFEGSKTDSRWFNNIKSSLPLEDKLENKIEFTFCAEIYQLFEILREDEFLDFIGVLKERDESFKQICDSTQFSEIYLFFDFDGHATKAQDNKVEDLLKFFNEETENGKLYISYPMVEAIKHVNDFNSFKDLTVDARNNIGYKEIVGKEGHKRFQKNFNKFDNQDWKDLMKAHLSKQNFIVNGDYNLPEDLISQLDIFLYQEEKYLKPHDKVSVLSPFPAFFIDYKGISLLEDLL